MEDNVKEVTLREVFLTVGGYLNLIRRYWPWLVVGGLALATYFVYDARTTPITYEAPLTFVVNEDSPSGGGVGSILGQFGLGGSGAGEFNLNKILALAESQKIMNNLLLDSIPVDGQRDKVSNHILREYDLQKEWELEGVAAISGDSLSELNRDERKLLKRLYRFVLDKQNGLLRFSADETTGILDVTANTVNEDLSLELAENLYQRLSDFYTMESIGSSLASVTRLQFKADSIKTALDQADYNLATSYDRGQGIIRRTDLIRQAQLNREVQVLSLAYGEVLQSLEKATFMLNTKTPFFQTVDEPFLPLSINGENWINRGIMGFILGAFLVFAGFSGRKFYLDVMNSEPTP